MSSGDISECDSVNYWEKNSTYSESESDQEEQPDYENVSKRMKCTSKVFSPLCSNNGLNNVDQLILIS